MDPKMDSGCLQPGETMEDDYDFGQPLLPEEIIGIIDQLLCHEASHFSCNWQISWFNVDGLAYGISAFSNDFY